MKWVRIIFFAFMIFFSFGICLLAAQVYATGFHLSEHGTKTLNIFAFALPLIFIISMFLGLLDDDHYLRRLIYPINFFAGLALYIFLSSVVLSIIILIASGIAITLPTSISITSFSAACILGIVGAIQAKRTKTTTYAVSLPGAPESWNTKVAVLVSDTHFGLINHKKFSDKIVKNILKLKPDFVLHAGDFYDGPKNNMAPLIESWKKLTKEIPVFYTSGNHELYGNYEAFISSILEAGIYVLLNEFIEHEGVQIAGITYHAKNQKLKAHDAMVALGVDKNKPLILINHPPTFHDSAINIEANLMVSGHTHRGQFWPLNYITEIMYKKFHYGLNKKQNLTAITTSGVGTSGPPIRLFNTPELVVIRFTNK
ncbi:MAG: metallophosphoesterase [Patescibacteria group bacterium]